MTYSNFVGIDVSKFSFQVSVMDKNNNITINKSLEMNKQGFDELKSITNNLNNFVIGLESTGIYHINLLYFITSITTNIILINPYLIKNFIKAISLRKTKTDKIDANIIAKFLQKNIENLNYYNEKNFIVITQLSRKKDKIIKNITSAKNQIKQMINMIFPEIANNFNIFSKFFINFFEKYSTPNDILNASKTKINNCIKKLQAGKGNKIKINYDILYKLAKNSIGFSDNGLKVILKTELNILKVYMQELKTINDTFITYISEHFAEELEILTSIKGVGQDSAAKLITEIKDINRFFSYKQLIAYIGTDPAIYQSGKAYKRGKISKRGNSHLRRLVYIMAQCLKNHNPIFKTYFQKKRDENMPYRKAIIATANKAIRVIFTMLKNKTTFYN